MAVLAAGCDLLTLLLLHLLAPSVDPRTEPTSQYVHSAWGVLARAATAAVGVAALALAGALRRPRGAVVVLVLFGATKLLLPLVPIDPSGASASAAGTLHNVLGNVAFLALPVAAALLLRPQLRSRARVPAGVAIALLASVPLVLAGEALGVFGLTQRAHLVLTDLWLIMTARWTLHRPRRPA